MSTTEPTKTLAGRPWPNGEQATWVYVADLPTPPEVVAKVEQLRRDMGWWWPWWWKKRIERATQIRKCEHYFLGKQVIYKQTPRGMLVLRADEPGSEENHAFQAAAAERGEPLLIWTFYDLSKATDWFHLQGPP
jgi:hypothetical protein